MSLVRLLGFENLPCRCVVGFYRDAASKRDLAYVEEKGATCDLHSHRRNHTVPTVGPAGLSGRAPRRVLVARP